MPIVLEATNFNCISYWPQCTWLGTLDLDVAPSQIFCRRQDFSLARVADAASIFVRVAPSSCYIVFHDVFNVIAESIKPFQYSGRGAIAHVVAVCPADCYCILFLCHESLMLQVLYFVSLKQYLHGS